MFRAVREFLGKEALSAAFKSVLPWTVATAIAFTYWAWSF